LVEAVALVIGHAVKLEMGTISTDFIKLCNSNVAILTATLGNPECLDCLALKRFYPWVRCDGLQVVAPANRSTAEFLVADRARTML
jgi:hypothetical protein